jgi:hypothetical protein
MTTEDQTQAVYAQIGKFMCAFSALEQELNEAIRVVFKLHDNDWWNVIVASLSDFARKVNTVAGAMDYARTVDGKLPQEDVIKQHKKLLNKVKGFNQTNRVLVAHSLLEPKADGTLQMTRMTVDGQLKITPHVWTLQNLEEKIQELESMARDIRGLRSYLSTLNYVIDMPSGLMLDASAFGSAADTVRSGEA